MPLDKPLNLNFEQDAHATRRDQSQRLANAEGGRYSEYTTEDFKRELHAKNKMLDAKNQKINELTIKNRQLATENDDIQARQKILEEELGKAEAQIQLIEELLLNEGAEQEQSTHE